MKKEVLILLLFISIYSFSQETATIKGKLKKKDGSPVEFANISVKNNNSGTTTNQYGEYKIKVPANIYLTIIISHIEMTTDTVKLKLKPNQLKKITTILKTNYQIIEGVTIEDKEKRVRGITRLDSKKYEIIPSTGSGIESLIKTLPGVSSNNELSSQYTVRGGNFDENLVYVNDVEIYRPQLVKSGEQEGLSFINPDLVKSVEFSAGGFEAIYGDKMSSVLDVSYKKPSKFGGSFSASLLGGTAHLEGRSNNHKLTYLIGARYKSNAYLLSSLDTKGEYNPRFWDIQTYITYEVNEFLSFAYLGNYTDNTFNFAPVDRKTSFGTVNEALGLRIYFEGQEADKFQTLTNALTSTYKLNEKTRLKFIASGFTTKENETYDILGQYYLNELEKDLSSENVGDSLMNIGVGSFLTHARNKFYANVYNFEHKGEYKISKQNKLFWGAKYRNENIFDQINQWEMRDSAGYSLPFPDTMGYNPDFVNLYSTVNTKNTLLVNKYSFYLQDLFFFKNGKTEYNLNLGIRFLYTDVNNEFLTSPRGSFSIIPDWEKDIVFRIASGIYYQPPFFKEYRKMNGELNLDVKSQKSIHFVVGSDYNFKMWKRPFKFITEVYYKILDDLNPYIVDNVSIRYMADNSAKGYAAGIDFKLTGEFVPGTDSWASLSIMKTEQDIDGDNHGFIPRPSDQRVNFGIFFQDYVPKFPSWKVHLNLIYGSGLVFGPPNSELYKHTLRMPDYKRVDLGFTKILIDENTKIGEHNFFRHFRNIWLTAEVFNVLGVNNTISHIWIKDIRNRQYAVPNYLTGRRLNIKLTVKF